MADTPPRSAAEESLFLKHYTRGKEMFDQQKWSEAERELEEAYLLRPRDLKVMNLLGLSYFRQEKLEKAEEIYRKLVAESPEAHTLFYNLGLIYFKLNRMEEAESAFLKSLALVKENAKINFYLGAIYERMRRFQDSIYQYRQAGANMMVHRVEDKIASTGPRAPRPHRPGSDDTAEFRPDAVQEALLRRADPALGSAKTLRPVSDALLAPRPRAHPSADTARFRPIEVASAAEATQPPAVTLPPGGAPGPAEQAATAPVPAVSGFRLLDKGLMEVNFSGKVFIKQGTIYSYSGNVTFWVKEKRPAGNPALVIITGTGRVLLTDKDREITFIQVASEPVYVGPSHLLACEETLIPRYVQMGGGSPPIEFVALEGRGTIALSVASKALAMAVTPDLPVSVPAASVISWTGSLSPRMVEDRQLYEVMLAPSSGVTALLRLEGTGRVLVEQTLLGRDGKS